MGTNISRVKAVQEIAAKITQDAIDKMTANGADTDEDYADAFDSVGMLFKYLSAQLMYDVYAQDDDQDTARFLGLVLAQEQRSADDALQSLRPFDIEIGKVEMLGGE